MNVGDEHWLSPTVQLSYSAAECSLYDSALSTPRQTSRRHPIQSIHLPLNPRSRVSPHHLTLQNIPLDISQINNFHRRQVQSHFIVPPFMKLQSWHALHAFLIRSHRYTACKKDGHFSYSLFLESFLQWTFMLLCYATQSAGAAAEIQNT